MLLFASCICLSSAEAEYVGATEACKDTMWLSHMLQELGLKDNFPTRVYEDNEACIKMASNPMITGRNKHMQIKMGYLRERVESQDVKFVWIPSSKQIADLLTKNLPRPKFDEFRKSIMEPSDM